MEYGKPRTAWRTRCRVELEIAAKVLPRVCVVGLSLAKTRNEIDADVTSTLDFYVVSYEE